MGTNMLQGKYELGKALAGNAMNHGDASQSDDYIGGQAPGLYDDHGNIKQGMTEAERTSYNTWSAIVIIPSAPFAMAELLPPEVWKAISILLGAVK